MFKSTDAVTRFQWLCEFVTLNVSVYDFSVVTMSDEIKVHFQKPFQNCLTESISVEFIAALVVLLSVLINSGQSGSVTESGISRNCSLGDLLMLNVNRMPDIITCNIQIN